MALGEPRVSAWLTADEKFLVVGTTFDEPAAANPDDSPICGSSGTATSVTIGHPQRVCGAERYDAGQ
jgi:hypothetical protein